MAFIREIVSFEKKKLVLPILAILLLSSFLVGLYNYRANHYGEKQAVDRGIADFNSSAVRIEHEYFNDSFSETEHERANQFYPANQADIEMTNDFLYISIMIGGYAYQSNIFPLMPSSTRTLQARGYGIFKDKTILFSPTTGYVFSEDVFYSRLEWDVKEHQLNELDRKVNESPENWTLEELRAEIDSIRNSNINKEEMSEFIDSLKERRFASEVDSGRIEKVKQMVQNDKIREVKLWHFIPAFMATFALYYLINGIIVVGIRNIRMRVGNNSSQI